MLMMRVGSERRVGGHDRAGDQPVEQNADLAPLRNGRSVGNRPIGLHIGLLAASLAANLLGRQRWQLQACRRSPQLHLPASMPQSRRASRAQSKTLRGITGLHVIEEKASVKNGKIDEYRVTMELTFILEG
jgi:hypothetical protein